jgi:hypothetical protein
MMKPIRTISQLAAIDNYCITKMTHAHSLRSSDMWYNRTVMVGELIHRRITHEVSPVPKMHMFKKGEF